MAEIRLGRVQYAIMEVLWRKRRATAREITEELDEAPPLAHSTVQTLLRKLEAKKVVAHEGAGAHLLLPRACGAGRGPGPGDARVHRAAV